MSQFAGETVVSVDQFSVSNESATQTCTQGNHDKIFHTFGPSVYHFPYGCRICIVGQVNRKSGIIFFHHVAKRNDIMPS